jgi:hypothetical protein
MPRTVSSFTVCVGGVVLVSALATEVAFVIVAKVGGMNAAPTG